MPFFIAEKEKDGTFKLIINNDGLTISDGEVALKAYKSHVQLYGTTNVMLLEQVPTNITISVEIIETKIENKKRV